MKSAEAKPKRASRTLRDLYPPIVPYRTGFLQVSEMHRIYYEEVGNPKGKPVVFLHGGPGGGIEPQHRQYFNPKKWRVVLFDQRGCGKSTPFAELRENTTWDLVADIERLREQLGIEKWTVFGGSWGSTLALAYSETYPNRCAGLILRGIFLLRQKEVHWFYQEGANYFFPDAWEHYLEPIPPKERGDMIAAYYKRLTSPNAATRLRAAKAWSVWEGTLSKLQADPKHIARFAADNFAVAFARIECHYFINKGFFEHDDELLRRAKRIAHLPTIIVQGRYDVICPPISAWELHKALPKSELIIVPQAGHAASEVGIRSALVQATDRFARL
ncbi:MAG: prolyl aminopeptidase [[Chlorobium] sp. 445]|nr:MAG: prolyl aminopeptidase [[Chlorobium] sp. 445]